MGVGGCQARQRDGERAIGSSRVVEVMSLVRIGPAAVVHTGAASFQSIGATTLEHTGTARDLDG